MGLTACERCDGFLPRPEVTCPNCGAKPRRSRLAARLSSIALGGGFAVTLMACYGAPHHYREPPMDPTQDQDGDGFAAKDDCDDYSADIRPGAPDKDGDGVDSDCDGLDSAAAPAVADPNGSGEPDSLVTPSDTP